MKKIFQQRDDLELINLHNKYGNKWKKIYAARSNHLTLFSLNQIKSRCQYLFHIFKRKYMLLGTLEQTSSPSEVIKNI